MTDARTRSRRWRAVPRAHARAGARLRLRATVPAILVAVLVGCATAQANGGGGVRVLVYDGVAALDIGAAAEPHRVELAAGQLRVDGETVGSHWSPSGRGPWRVGSRTLRGRVAVRARSGRIQVLNRVDLESYVASTVGGEMSASWPAAALRAQAVATRTYVLHEAARRSSNDWDVSSTATSQVYRGIGAETEETRAAARATRGEILTHRGEPILAVFHSTAGGRTATAGEVWGEDRPYLRVVDVEGEDIAPHTYWRMEFAGSDLTGVVSVAGVEVGDLDSLSVTRRTRGGRVERLEIRGAQGRRELRGSALRSLVGTLGLRSTLFDVRETASGFAFVGSGFGHGVGMSQWGARALAERGLSYQRILARFYPGTRLERWSSRRLAGNLSPTPSVAADRGR
ncbi:MAG: SpoIID/LytB domain-containing protein [bacterium]|nr:SpoIID/LytB domain-containing protein [bacterium]